MNDDLLMQKHTNLKSHMKHYKEDSGFSNVNEIGSNSYLKVSRSNYGLISK